LRNRLEFIKQDYRTLQGTFDRIVSVGMFEHVGINNYPTYFKQIKKLLKPGGRALVHTIGRSDGPGFTNPFISRYIFPGGYFPALSEMMPVIEQSGLVTCDIEVLRLHYAETLRAWRERFVENWAEAARRHDERFCRMWEFYLAGAEMGFRHHGLVVIQVLLAHDVDSVPIAAPRLRARRPPIAGSP
jgi:cyclopropane-fatty-acyl-phospholipid synthase